MSDSPGRGPPRRLMRTDASSNECEKSEDGDRKARRASEAFRGELPGERRRALHAWRGADRRDGAPEERAGKRTEERPDQRVDRARSGAGRASSQRQGGGPPLDPGVAYAGGQDEPGKLGNEHDRDEQRQG